MNDSLVGKLKRVLNKEYVKRLLTRYFIENKRYETLDNKIYPPMIQDICESIPQLSDKLEVVPYIEEIDPIKKKIEIGWNLFVLGCRRMFLGTSIHESMSDIQLSRSGMYVGQSESLSVTPKELIEFVINELDNRKSGIIDNNQMTPIHGSGVTSAPFYMYTQQSAAGKTVL